MSAPQVSGASPCHVRYISTGETHNVVAWVTDADADLGAAIVRDGALEILWQSQQRHYDNIAFHDGVAGSGGVS